MKRTIYIALLFLIFGITTTSCKKDKTNENPIVDNLETSMDTIFKNNGNSDIPDTDSYELGIPFSSSTAGKITKLGLKLPVNGTYEVSLWDFDSRIKLDSVMVNNSDSSKFNYATISARSIVIDKKYVVSLNTNGKNYFGVYKTALFPLTVGSITMYSQIEGSTNSNAFPGFSQSLNRCFGIPAIVFKAD